MWTGPFTSPSIMTDDKSSVQRMKELLRLVMDQSNTKLGAGRSNVNIEMEAKTYQC